MNITSITKKADSLVTKLSSFKSETIRERIYAAYCQSALASISDILNAPQNEDILLNDLKKLLKSNWDMVKRTSLCYTVIPESDITLFFADIAEFIVECESTKENKPSAIALLMPDVCIESASDNYTNLDAHNVKTLMKTHALGEGRYLIPARELTRLEAGNTSTFKPHNNYFDYRTHKESQAFLNKEEVARLFRHSPETIALYEASVTYDKSLEDASNLYSHLIVLCKHLNMNSKNGRGGEYNAASGCYPAIIAFNEYYQTVSDEDKKSIPKLVRDEIELILTLSSDKKVNINATANMDTCIATRHEKLMAAIKSNEEALKAIAVSDEKKATLQDEALKRFNTCRDELLRVIDAGKYKGCDTFGIDGKVLQQLEVRVSIQSLAELHDFLTLAPENIKAFCNDALIKEAIVSQIKSIEDWVSLAIDTRPAALEALLSEIGANLSEQLIHLPEDSVALLIALTGERFDIVLKCVQASLVKTITTTDKLSKALRHLSPEQCAAVCTMMKDSLPDLIKDGYDFGSALAYLTPEERVAVYTVMKDRLPDLIKNASDLESILHNLVKDKQKAFLESEGIVSLLPKRILNIAEDIPAMHRQMSSPEMKNTFNKAYFSGLLLEFKAFIDSMPDKSDASYTAADELHTYLTKESHAHFTSPNPSFQKNCIERINQTKDIFRANEGFVSWLGKIALALITMGLIPLVSAIKSKVETGIFKCRFFEVPGERKLDNMVVFLGELRSIPG